jgi:hypothetical protein
MVAADQGWEMAFYFSPMAFLVMDGLLLIGGILAAVGVVVGPRLIDRIVATLAGAAGVGWFTLSPWR